MITFKETKFKFEQDLQIGSSGNVAVWEFTGNPDSIEEIKPGCSCTANCRLEGNRIVAEYTDHDGPKVNKERIPKLYPNNKLTFSKNVYIYLKDGQPMKIKNERGVFVPNPLKTNIELSFVGTIDLSPLTDSSSS